GGPNTGICERLRAAIAHEPISTSAGAVSITVSIGVAAGGGPHSAESLIAVADAAMYEAKRAGRNRVAYSPSVKYANGREQFADEQISESDYRFYLQQL
ncbi:MAG TPA: diguanylate cyclase, partial [Acidobacteriota bacterium]|nr:diguanylate cyclase [Acidobacteriota bacterium]